ncbi:MAG: hypothetical protein KKA84_06725 [Bacteroidetes bacterium]|nr:hypothetical protein [Bacteroidota bacterium]
MNTIKKWFFNWGRLSLLIAGFFAGSIQSQLTEYLPPWLLVLSVVFFGVWGLLHWYLAVKTPEPNIKAESHRWEHEQKRYARKGLVVFLSAYHHNKKNFSEAELKECIDNRDYVKMELDNYDITNFGHTLKAIVANLLRLEHCWIITTRAADSRSVSSLDYLPVLISYLENKIDKSKKINFYHGDDYCINISEDSQVCIGTSNLIKRIYKEGLSKHKLEAKEIIADVTGGTTSMKVGTVLASLAKDQDVQVIGAIYDPVTGRPKGGKDSYPIVIGYEPHIVKELDS